MLYLGSEEALPGLQEAHVALVRRDLAHQALQLRRALPVNMHAFGFPLQNKSYPTEACIIYFVSERIIGFPQDFFVYSLEYRFYLFLWTG